MPTYLELERSTEQSRPIELYEVTLGTTVHRWTSAEDPFTVGSDTFDPEPGLRRGRILQGVGGRARGVEFSMPATNAFASRYSRLPPSEKATFRLFRAQRDETPTPTVVLIATGTVFTVRWEDDGRVAKVAVRSAEEQLEQMLPRFTFMAQCNHYVYDAFCGADPAMHNHVGTVTAQDGTALTVSGVGASPMFSARNLTNTVWPSMGSSGPTSTESGTIRRRLPSRRNSEVLTSLERAPGESSDVPSAASQSVAVVARSRSGPVKVSVVLPSPSEIASGCERISAPF